MDRIKFLFAGILWITSLSLLSQTNFTLDCFSILVGKNASFDGSVLLAHNEDDWGDRVVNWYKVPEQSHDKDAAVQLKNGAEMPLPTTTWSYLWLEMPEMDFSDSYMNEWGVTIASDACLSREDDPELTDGGIGYWLRRAMAMEARSARQAVKIGGSLVDHYGYYSSGRSYCIADANEVWMLSVVKGKHWVARRVPDDHVAIIPNYYTITTVDLDDTLNFYGSPDLISYAEERGWYDPETEGDFNFRLAYSDTGNLKNMGNIVRHWSALNMIGLDTFQINGDFPFSFQPPEKVGLEDIFAVLRNHNEGTEYDQSDNYKKGSPHDFGRAICSKTTQYGFVAQLRNNLPKEMAYVMWLAPFRPCVHPFTQWYFGISEIPASYARGSYESALKTHFKPIEKMEEYAPKHAFLKYVDFAKGIDTVYAENIDEIRSKAEMLEEGFIQKQPVIESRILKIFDTDPEQAIKALTGYSQKQLEQSENLMK